MANETHLGRLIFLHRLLALDLDLSLVGDLGDGSPLHLPLLLLDHLDGLRGGTRGVTNGAAAPRHCASIRCRSFLSNQIARV